MPSYAVAECLVCARGESPQSRPSTCATIQRYLPPIQMGYCIHATPPKNDFQVAINYDGIAISVRSRLFWRRNCDPYSFVWPCRGPCAAACSAPLHDRLIALTEECPPPPPQPLPQSPTIGKIPVQVHRRGSNPTTPAISSHRVKRPSFIGVWPDGKLTIAPPDAPSG